MANPEYPIFNTPEYEEREAILRPRRVAAARQRQPLLQFLKDSLIGALIEERAETSLPELVIRNRPYFGGFGIAAETYPREDDVDIHSAISESRTWSPSPMAEGRWTIDVYPRPNDDLQFDTTLLLELWCQSNWRRGVEEGISEADINTITIELDQDKNLKVVGSREYFNGSVDHLNKRGLNRVRTAFNKAFKKPAISDQPFSIGTASA